MSADVAIRVQGLDKTYRIAHQAERPRYTTLREDLMGLPRRLLQTLSRAKAEVAASTSEEEFHALKDVSFEIKQGEVVGIIGRNGAGKSTLLKILSRITEPTAGRVEVYGRLSALLEVGTGFHPELTGRENIYLNGAILGMRRAEIRAKFDEIVAFAEVERFLDTPVKRYSSGMYVRLAFAVAANLEPEILVVDEVLAVGDAEFQQKCLGKMESVSKQEGRTVLFVSHQMGMITSLCNRGILLEAGRVVAMGSSAEVVRTYYARGHASPAVADFTTRERLPGDDMVRLEECHIENTLGRITPDLDISEPVTVAVRFRVLKETQFARTFTYPQINLYSTRNELLFSCTAPNAQLGNFQPGSYIARCQIPGDFLNNDTYYVGVGMASCENGVNVHFYENQVLSFQIGERLNETLYTTRNGFSGAILGGIRPQLAWQIKPVKAPVSAPVVSAR